MQKSHGQNLFLDFNFYVNILLTKADSVTGEISLLMPGGLRPAWKCAINFLYCSLYGHKLMSIIQRRQHHQSCVQCV